MNTFKTASDLVTISGGKVTPLTPHLANFTLEDIACGLAKQCRFGGHCKGFYSVAEHSVAMAHLMPTPQLARIALLHDAAEAYLGDLPLAVKNLCPDFMWLEREFWLPIACKFGLPKELPSEVKEADKRMLVTEKHQLIGDFGRWEIEDYYEPYDIELKVLSYDRAMDEFMVMAKLLFPKMV